MKRLYKLGGSIKFEGIMLDAIAIEDKDEEKYKAEGWDCAWAILEKSKNSKDSEAVEAEFTEITEEDIDTNKSGKLSVNEVRTAARDSGIEGWEKKRIKTLKKELGLDDDDEQQDS